MDSLALQRKDLLIGFSFNCCDNLLQPKTKQSGGAKDSDATKDVFHHLQQT